jgi:hypothetical protein
MGRSLCCALAVGRAEGSSFLAYPPFRLAGARLQRWARLLTGLRPCAFQGRAATSPSVYSFFSRNYRVTRFSRNVQSCECPSARSLTPTWALYPFTRKKRRANGARKMRPSLTGFGMKDVKVVGRVFWKFEIIYLIIYLKTQLC